MLGSLFCNLFNYRVYDHVNEARDLRKKALPSIIWQSDGDLKLKMEQMAMSSNKYEVFYHNIPQLQRKDNRAMGAEGGHWCSAEGVVEVLTAARLYLHATRFRIGMDLGTAAFAAAPRVHNLFCRGRIWHGNEFAPTVGFFLTTHPSQLGQYNLDSFGDWEQLSSYLSQSFIERLEPTGGEITIALETSWLDRAPQTDMER
ncbi:uncharacterized protein [Aegilops tauschii subsp. strangulata]|uniref:uncharacterized protein isoform X2 n=2 Tax=Aegilops tauschii subsp. strangulata TaxID=200361 RepID=UPI001E1CAB83|nr:uncharacterized protein LOC109754520 isoform X3 [Aegilops tauschii subsp. strangulata]